MDGETEETLVKLFNCPSQILILDNIDEVIESGSAFISPLLSLLLDRNKRKALFVIAITSRPYILNTNLKSKFDNILRLPLPSLSTRVEVLQQCMNGICKVNKGLSNELDPSILKQVALKTQGFTPADLTSIVRVALLSLNDSIITGDALMSAAENARPANLRDIITSIPKVTFADLFGISDILGSLMV